MLRELRDVVEHAPPHAAPPGATSDWTIDQRWEAYTPAQHAVWKTLFARQNVASSGKVTQ